MAKKKKVQGKTSKSASTRKGASRKRLARTSPRRKSAKAAPKSGTKRKRVAKFKVFIAWAGDRSKEVGSEIRSSLHTIVPKVEILFSPTIAAGDAWARRLQAWLRRADYAILCVTKESLNSSWMNYEAGATWKALRQANVCPLLLDVQPTDLSTSPLSLFQGRQFIYGDFEDLCKYLGRKTRMNSDVVKGNLDNVWGTLEGKVKKILSK